MKQALFPFGIGARASHSCEDVTPFAFDGRECTRKIKAPAFLPGLLSLAHPLSGAPARRAAGIAFEARAVAHHGKVAAFAAAFALIALHPRLRAPV